MLTTTILRVMANAILAADPNIDDVTSQLRHVLGRVGRWIRPLATRYTQRFPGTAVPRRREVIEFLRNDTGLRDAARKRPLHIVHWVTGPRSMRPVAAATLWPVPTLTSTGDLAHWLNVTPTELQWFADLKGLDSNQQPQGKLDHYHYRAQAKKTGSIRLVESPKARLKGLQRRILHDILDHIPAHPSVHGFVKGRSIRSFATPHVGQRVVLRMDIQDFFPSFAGARVQSFFRTAGYPEQVADLLGGIATNAVPRSLWKSVLSAHESARSSQNTLWQIKAMYARPHLPQGAPTSPALANLCSYRMDCRLHGLALSAGSTYTRYADDLVFSGDAVLARGITRFSTGVAAILREEGFAVNLRKTRIMHASTRQHVAGVVVNQRLNVPRTEFDVLKAILTNCVRHSPAEQNREGHPNFQGHLAGRISFLESIHPERGRRLRVLFDKVVWG